VKAQVVLMPNQKSGILGGVRYPIHMNANAIKINIGFIFAFNTHHEFVVFLDIIKPESKPIVTVEPSSR